MEGDAARKVQEEMEHSVQMEADPRRVNGQVCGSNQRNNGENRMAVISGKHRNTVLITSPFL